MPKGKRDGVSGKAETFRHEIREGDVSLTLVIRNLGDVSDELRAKVADAMFALGYVRFMEELQSIGVLGYVPLAKARA